MDLLCGWQPFPKFSLHLLSFRLRAVIFTETHPSFGFGHRVVERLRFRHPFVCWENSAPHLYPVLIQFQVKPEV